MEDPEDVLRVGSASPPEKLASAISHRVYQGKQTTLRAIGAGAVNQAVKAVIIAQGFVAPRGKVLSMRGGFTDITMDDGKTITGTLIQVLVE